MDNTRELRKIVTRGGKSVRIPELLEAELDELEAYIAHRQNGLLDAVVADAPKDDNSIHVFPGLLEHAKGVNETNKKWRAAIQRHRVQDGVQDGVQDKVKERG